MTDEQIKQNARTYAHKEYMLCSGGEKEAAIKDFIAGAHSRDEEVEQLRAELNNPWSKVEKELPSEDTEVVTYLRGTMVIGYRIGERWYMHGIAIDTPTHWMPIPSVEGGEK